MRSGNLSYEDSILHVMKRDVMRQKCLGPFASKKVPTTGEASSASSATTIAAAQSKSDEARLLRLQECLKADQVNPFIDANEPDVIDRRDIGAVLDQHIGPRQGSGLFSRRVGHSLKLAKFGVYSASSVTTSHGVSSTEQRTAVTGSVSTAPSLSLARRLMVPLQQRPAAPAFRVWPVGSNPNTASNPALPPTTLTAEGTTSEAMAQDSTISNMDVQDPS